MTNESLLIIVLTPNIFPFSKPLLLEEKFPIHNKGHFYGLSIGYLLKNYVIFK